MQNCPYCSGEIDDDALFCQHCGRELQSPITGDLPPSGESPPPLANDALGDTGTNLIGNPTKPAPTMLSRMLPYVLLLVIVLCLLFTFLCFISKVVSVVDSEIVPWEKLLR